MWRRCVFAAIVCILTDVSERSVCVSLQLDSKLVYAVAPMGCFFVRKVCCHSYFDNNYSENWMTA